MKSQSPQFGCFTLEQPTTPGSIFHYDTGSEDQSSRRRKVHTKSRSGCTNCKARKVKCDEDEPCRNCVKRDLKCSFITCPKSSLITRRRPNQKSPGGPSTAPSRELSTINLEHLRLLHHFQTFTSETFVMDPKLWKGIVMSLAFENTFLMHTVFLVTANHLHHLQPHEKEYQVAALEHLSYALPMFRDSISKGSDFKGSHGVALVACSMLLLQYSWTFNSEAWNSILGLYWGQKDVIFGFINTLEERGQDPLITLLAYSPRLHIEHYFDSIEIPSDIRSIFSHCLTCTKISDATAENPSDFTEPSRHLMNILHALSLDSRNLEESGLMLDVARYMFSWPNLMPTGYINLLRAEDGRAQVIMLYYFAAVSRLRAERFWWMRERSLYMFEAIFSSIGDKCKRCTSRAREIFSKEDCD